MAKRVISTLNIIAKPLPSSSLPTIGEVLSAIIDNKTENPSPRTYLAAVNAVTIDLIRIWSKHSIPVVTKSRVRQILLKELNEYRQLVKVPTKHRTQNVYTEKVSKFKVNSIYSHTFCNSVWYNSFDPYLQEKSKVLLDISACKCEDLNNCTCPPTKTIPKAKRNFLFTQRNRRSECTTTLKAKRKKTSNALGVVIESSTEYCDHDDNYRSSYSDNSDDSPVRVRRNYNTMRLDKVAETADRVNCSSNKTAAIVTAAFENAGK